MLSDDRGRPATTITNHVQDLDGPILFSLGAGAPAGASIFPSGVFNWMSSCDQASSTNLITIWARDSYSIPLSNSISFVVVVSECLQVGVGYTVMQVGTTSSVPANIISTLGVTNLTFIVSYPTNQFTNWVMISSNNAIGRLLVQTISDVQTMFSLAANSGQTLTGPALLGSISFQALPGPSAFAPLVVTMLSDSTVGNSGGQPGRAVVIGPEPLLEAWLNTNGTRMVTLYGNPGSSYQFGSRTNLLGTNWQPGLRVPLTNLYEFFAADGSQPQLFYRAWEFFADPPILQLGPASSTNLVLLMYGKAGSNYVIQSATNLAGPVSWLPATNFILTNSFRFIGTGNQTNNALFFRAVRP